MATHTHKHTHTHTYIRCAGREVTASCRVCTRGGVGGGDGGWVKRSRLQRTFFFWDNPFLEFWWPLLWVQSQVDHSGNDARFVLMSNIFSKKVTSNRAWTLDPMTGVFPVSCLSNCVNWGSLTPLLFVHQLTLDLEQLRGFCYNQ